ncbi:unnamed protein product, partial [Amoebophrya sp. A25]
SNLYWQSAARSMKRSALRGMRDLREFNLNYHDWCRFAISAPAESCESAISIWKEKILQRQDVCNGDQVPSSAKEVEKEWLDEAMETATADDTRILAEKCCISEKEHEEEMQTRKELDRAKE